MENSQTLILQELQGIKDKFRIKILKNGGWPISFRVSIPPHDSLHLDLDTFEVVFTLQQGYPSLSAIDIAVTNTDISDKVKTLLVSVLLNQASFHSSLSHPIVASLVGWLNSQAVLSAIAPYTESYFTTQADGSTERRVTFKTEVEIAIQPQSEPKKKKKGKKSVKIQEPEPQDVTATVSEDKPAEIAKEDVSEPPTQIEQQTNEKIEELPRPASPIQETPTPPPSKTIEKESTTPKKKAESDEDLESRIVRPQYTSNRYPSLPIPVPPTEEKEMHLLACAYQFEVMVPSRIRRAVIKTKWPSGREKPTFPNKYTLISDTATELEFSLPLLPSDPEFPFFQYPSLQFSHFSFILNFKLHRPLSYEQLCEEYDAGESTSVTSTVLAVVDSWLTQQHLDTLSFMLTQIVYSSTIDAFRGMVLEPFPPFRRIVRMFERQLITILHQVDTSLASQQEAMAADHTDSMDDIEGDIDEDGDEAKADRETYRRFLAQHAISTSEEQGGAEDDSDTSEDDESSESSESEDESDEDFENDVFEVRKHALSSFADGKQKEAELKEFLQNKQQTAEHDTHRSARQRRQIASLEYDPGESLWDKRLREWEAQRGIRRDNDSDRSDSDDSNDDSEEFDESEELAGPLTGMSANQPQRPACTLKLDGLVLKNISLVRVVALSISVQCQRCLNTAKIQLPETHFNSSFGFECQKCHNSLRVTFHAAPIHEFSQVMGFFTDCARCMPVDYLPSSWMGTCENCNKESSFVSVAIGGQSKARSSGFAKDGDTSLLNQSTGRVCLKCFAQMTFVFEGVIFLDGQGNQIQQAVRDASKVKVKNQLLGFKVGQPLPKNGACRHYTHSYRWYRFPCCGKIYPCDSCHDREESHPMLWAKRMICGFCSKEQAVANECKNCGKPLTRTHTTVHWEGGKGCRDQNRMSKRDNKKFAGKEKTTSRKKQKAEAKKGK
ncbi:putative CHY zinc finger protein [Blattamonas nauphoetae]|uniref:CHY zinc finger protein n=1 Tax=Blattamonas nauphoetae TaxID=2049346 RepID=A0ABQ9XLA1_9EUKA|nr:putative CHY zinc finger protein [Blattamonas nauphoetae]